MPCYTASSLASSTRSSAKILATIIDSRFYFYDGSNEQEHYIKKQLHLIPCWNTLQTFGSVSVYKCTCVVLFFQARCACRCIWVAQTRPQRLRFARCRTQTTPHSGASDGVPTATTGRPQAHAASPDIRRSSDPLVDVATGFRHGYEVIFIMQNRNKYLFKPFLKLI